jgi:hypothetical protein
MNHSIAVIFAAFLVPWSLMTYAMPEETVLEPVKD